LTELVSDVSEDRSAELIARLTASANSSSRVERQIAAYLLSNLGELPFETGASLAEKAGVSAASISRFCRSIGYGDIKDLKASLKSGSGEPAWLIGDKLREFHRRSLMGNQQLFIALEKEIAALTAVYALAVTAEFDRVVQRLARCPKVFVAGFQAERGYGASLANNLQYLRPGIFQADVAGGHFAEILLSDPSKTCVVVFDGRRYSRLTRELAFVAEERGIPVTLISDPYCGWARGKVSEILSVQTDLNHFWDSTSAMSSLIGLLANGVFKILGAEVEDRMEQVSALYNHFIGHVGT
jgi:DNA-binding MurR/RpiR family transcriptional regulator